MEGADADRDMTLVLNAANPVVQAFPSLDEEKKTFVAKQVYYLAKLSYKKLSPDEMKDFSANSVQLLREIRRLIKSAQRSCRRFSVQAAPRIF